MLEPGQILGAYRIVRTLGAGGMGCVYEAEHVGLKVRRALKVFSSESEHCDLLRKRFVAEGRMLADLRHPRIVRVYDFAVDAASGTPYFAMDLVVSPTGEPLTLEGACKGGVDEERVSGWFRDISAGLAYIHAKGVVHRDISLDNILIDGDGHAVLTDFGVARIVGEEYRRKIDVTVTMPMPTGESYRWGKGLYMAPELKSGGVATPASDAYAFGILLFRVLVGSWYTPDTRLEDMLAGMDYNWAEIIGRLCDVRPDCRLGDDGLAGVSAMLHRADPLLRTSSRRRWVAAAGVVLLAAAGAAIFWPWRDKGPVVLAAAREDLSSAAVSKHGTEAISPAYRVVDVTNYVRREVFHVIPVTNVITRVAETQEVSSCHSPAEGAFPGAKEQNDESGIRTDANDDPAAVGRGEDR